MPNFVRRGGGSDGAGGDAAGEGRVVVDVELEQVEELVGDEGDGAVGLFLDPEVEFERPVRLVAGREGDILELAFFVGDMLSGVSVREDVVLAANGGGIGGRGRASCG